jgi:hypothetical protein
VPASARNSRTPATLLALLLAGFGLLHIYWALGGTWALDDVLGGPGSSRPPTSSLWIVASVLIAFAAGAWVLPRRQGLPLPVAIAARVSVWLVAAFGAMVALMNLLRGTTLTERGVIAPFALVLLILAVFSLRASRRGF